MVTTDLGVLRLDSGTKERTLVALHPGATLEGAKEATGWDLKVTDELETTNRSTAEELKVLRELKVRTAASRGERPDEIRLVTERSA